MKKVDKTNVWKHFFFSINDLPFLLELCRELQIYICTNYGMILIIIIIIIIIIMDVLTG